MEKLDGGGFFHLTILFLSSPPIGERDTLISRFPKPREEVDTHENRYFPLYSR